MKSTKLKVLIGFFITCLVIYATVTVVHNRRAGKLLQRAESLKVMLVSLRDDLKTKGYVDAITNSSSLDNPHVISDGSTCLDLDVYGTSCEPPAVQLLLRDNALDAGLRQATVDVLAQHGFTAVTSEDKDRLLNTETSQVANYRPPKFINNTRDISLEVAIDYILDGNFNSLKITATDVPL